MDIVRTVFLQILNTAFLFTLLYRVIIFFTLSYLTYAYLTADSLVTMLPGISNFQNFDTFASLIGWLKLGLLLYLFDKFIGHTAKCFKLRNEASKKINETVDKSKDK